MQKMHKKNSPQRLPNPQYMVLYNGTAPMPDVSEYRLSDAFESSQNRCCLECVATVLNINSGHNQELMGSCTGSCIGSMVFNGKSSACVSITT